MDFFSAESFSAKFKRGPFLTIKWGQTLYAVFAPSASARWRAK